MDPALRYKTPETSPKAPPKASAATSPLVPPSNSQVASFANLAYSIDIEDNDVLSVADTAAAPPPPPAPAPAVNANPKSKVPPNDSWVAYAMEYINYAMDNKAALLVAAGLIGLTLALFKAAPPLVIASAAVVVVSALMSYFGLFKSCPTKNNDDDNTPPAPEKKGLNCANCLL